MQLNKPEIELLIKILAEQKQTKEIELITEKLTESQNIETKKRINNTLF